MTNAEKFLKDGVDIEEIAKDYESFCNVLKENDIVMTYKQKMREFLNCEIKVTLTEDEKVILNHINIYEFDKIGRANNGNLYLHYRDDKDTEDFWWCDHLFQFIKNGEEYEIKELLKYDER